MASPTRGFDDQHQRWTLQRKAHVRTPYSAIEQQHVAGRIEVGGSPHRRGGIIFNLPPPSTAAYGSRMHPAGWPTVQAMPTSPAFPLPRRSPERFGGAAGWTSTVDVQSGILDRRTCCSTPNWFGMAGPHSDNYGPSYHSRRYVERPIASASQLMREAGTGPRAIGYSAFASPARVPEFRLP